MAGNSRNVSMIAEYQGKCFELLKVEITDTNASFLLSRGSESKWVSFPINAGDIPPDLLAWMKSRQ